MSNLIDRDEWKYGLDAGYRVTIDRQELVATQRALAESQQREAELQNAIAILEDRHEQNKAELLKAWTERNTLQQERDRLLKALDTASIKMANLTADLRVFENTANNIWRNQQMSTQAVASGLLDLIVKFADHAFVQIEAALGMKPLEAKQALAAKEKR
jgi:chromosome segregation ATPase